MGANKPSRFHGQKPRYKNIERTTLADISPVEIDGWEAESERYFADRQLNQFKESRIYGRRAAWKVPPNLELEDVVKRYLAARNIEAAPSEAAIKLEIHNKEIIAAPEIVRLETPAHALEPMQAAPAAHDILLQMFSQKKITQGLFHAGRRWQWDREAATLQPSVSIDWSRSSPSPYQSGDMDERQWSAIRRRRQFTTHAGIAAATMLDFLLEPDRGYQELVTLTAQPAIQIECSLEELLNKICECFA